MWQGKLCGILGFWLVLLAFLNFSSSLNKFLIVLTGVAIVVFSFFGGRIFKSSRELIDMSKQMEDEIKKNTDSGEDAEEDIKKENNEETGSV